MKKLSKKDRIILAVAGVALAIALCCQGWYYWPWFGGNIVRQNAKSTQLFIVEPYSINYPFDAICIENSSGLSKHFVCKLFGDIAVRTEYGNDNYSIRKWADPIRLFISGTPDKEDLSVIQEICDFLNDIPFFPGISIVDSEGNSNSVMNFFNDNEFNDWERHRGIRGAQGLACLFFSDKGDIASAEIGIRNMEDRYTKTSVIWEELLQSTGLKNDTMLYQGTLFYNGDYNVPKATALDYVLLRLLYLPQLRSGMSYISCIPFVLYYLK